MLLKKKNIVVNIPDNNKAEIERHIKELGFNEYKNTHYNNRNNVFRENTSPSYFTFLAFR